MKRIKNDIMRIVSLILTIASLITSILFICFYRVAKKYDTDFYLQNNLEEMKNLLVIGKEYEAKVVELDTLYDNADVSSSIDLQKVEASIEQINELKELTKKIDEITPVYSLAFDSEITGEDYYGETVVAFEEWREYICEETEKNLENDLLIDSSKRFKDELYDRKYKERINSGAAALLNTESFMISDSWKLDQADVADEYLISFIGFSIIFIFSLVVFFINNRINNKKLVIVNVVVAILFAIISTVIVVVAENDNKHNDMVNKMIAEANEEVNKTETIDDNKNKPVSSISNWGFNNLDEIGSGLVEITSYNLEAGYVYYTADEEYNIFKLENGFYITQVLNMDAKTLRTGYMSEYEPVNNDSFYLPGDGAFTIERREVISDDFVLFVDDNFGYFDTFYVPYSLIDWERGFDVYESDGEEDYNYTYKFYLK